MQLLVIACINRLTDQATLPNNKIYSTLQTTTSTGIWVTAQRKLFFSVAGMNAPTIANPRTYATGYTDSTVSESCTMKVENGDILDQLYSRKCLFNI